MKRIILIVFLIAILSGCTQKTAAPQTTVPQLSVEQVNSYKQKISDLANKKKWVLDQNINYVYSTLPAQVQNTYYSEILTKSKDVGFDFSKYLGKSIIEGTSYIKYSNGDIAGTAHFVFYQDKLVGAYYMVGNYIYSLNEKEVFKKVVNWEKKENTQKKATFKEIQFATNQNLIYWDKVNNVSYLYAWEGNKLKALTLDNNQLLLKSEITLEDLYIVSMFVKDIDKDKKTELALLLSNNSNWQDKQAKSKLIVYEIGDKLKQKYSLSFEQPAWSIDFDGKDLITTTANSIEIYSLEDSIFKKVYTYNKVGGVIKVDDIDGSGINRYILRDSTGTDIYVFERNIGLEEIWRSYNKAPGYDGIIQTGDLNGDGVKEIYLKDKLGNTRKIILQEKGFITKNDEIKEGHKFFVGDFNTDGKYEYFDTFKATKTNVLTTFYKYST